MPTHPTNTPPADAKAINAKSKTARSKTAKSNPAKSNPARSAGQIVDRKQRRALLDELDVEARALHLDVLRHTLADGVPVNPSALVVVLSAHDDLADDSLCFSADHVNELLWCGVADFCADYGLEMPDGCSAALHAVLAIGTALDALNPSSDPPAELFTAFNALAAM